MGRREPEQKRVPGPGQLVREDRLGDRAWRRVETIVRPRPEQLFEPGCRPVTESRKSLCPTLISGTPRRPLGCRQGRQPQVTAVCADPRHRPGVVGLVRDAGILGYAVTVAVAALEVGDGVAADRPQASR